MFGTNKRLDNIQNQMFDLEKNQLIMLSKIIKLQSIINTLESELKRINGKRKKSRPALSRKTGYTNVSPEERLEFYEMYKIGASMTDIATHFNRSQSCVSKNIEKILEEEMKNGTLLDKIEEQK